MVSFTEEQLAEMGYVRRSDGSFEKPRKKHRNDSNSRPMPLAEPSVLSEQKGSHEDEKRAEEISKSSYWLLVHAYRRRIIDPDNLCPKWCIDEMVKAKLLPDDSSAYVEGVIKSATKITTKEEESTEITLINL